MRATHCPWEASIAAYLQGELPPGARRAFAEHLARCTACEGELFELREVVEGLRRAFPGPEPAPLADTLPRVLDRIERGRPAARARARRTRWALAGAGAAACLAISALFLARRGPSIPPRKGGMGEAVARARAWLTRAQERQGRWNAGRWGGDPRYDVGVTGLSILALLGDERSGETDLPQAVRAGLGFIARSQAPDGRFGPRFPGTPYNHGVATLAVLEAFGLTREADLRGPSDAAVGYLRQTQLATGAWDYPEPAARRGDPSITAWALQALLVAKGVGWSDLDGPIARALAWLSQDRRIDPASPPPGRLPGIDIRRAAILLCRALNGEALSVRDAAHELLDRVTVLRGSEAGLDDFHRGFFLTYALLGALGPERDLGPADPRHAFLSSQAAAGPLAGSWAAADRWSPRGGRVYATAFATLALEADRRLERLLAWGQRPPAGGAPGLRRPRRSRS